MNVVLKHLEDNKREFLTLYPLGQVLVIDLIKRIVAQKDVKTVRDIFKELINAAMGILLFYFALNEDKKKQLVAFFTGNEFTASMVSASNLADFPGHEYVFNHGVLYYTLLYNTELHDLTKRYCGQRPAAKIKWA